MDEYAVQGVLGRVHGARTCCCWQDSGVIPGVSAMDLGLSATSAPSWPIRAIASGLRSYTITLAPDLMRFIAIGDPILPIPMKPIVPPCC